MAHLVKLEDYVSRYEMNIQRFPSQFARLKRERWAQLQQIWLEMNQSHESADEDDWFQAVEKNLFQQTITRVRNIYRGTEIKKPTDFHSSQYHHLVGKTRQELQTYFYYELFQSQLKWASSSMSQKSRLDIKYRFDSRLREILQLFPDNFLVFYYPVFLIQKADVEMDVLLISPTEVYALTYLETERNAIIAAGSERFWIEYRRKQEKKRLNPTLATNRMEEIIRSIFSRDNIDFPVKTAVLAPHALIEDPGKKRGGTIVDQRNHRDWLESLMNHPSPLKKEQLRAAESLLKQGKTTIFSP